MPKTDPVQNWRDHLACKEGDAYIYAHGAYSNITRRLVPPIPSGKVEEDDREREKERNPETPGLLVTTVAMATWAETPTDLLDGRLRAGAHRGKAEGTVAAWQPRLLNEPASDQRALWRNLTNWVEEAAPRRIFFWGRDSDAMTGERKCLKALRPFNADEVDAGFKESNLINLRESITNANFGLVNMFDCDLRDLQKVVGGRFGISWSRYFEDLDILWMRCVQAKAEGRDEELDRLKERFAREIEERLTAIARAHQIVSYDLMREAH